MALGLGTERQYGRGRFRLLRVIVALALSALMVRLYILQVLRHDEFRQKSESNFVQSRRIKHDRGTIRDRDGRVLVDNRPSHDVFVTPAFMPDTRVDLSRLLKAAGSSVNPRDVAQELARTVELPSPPPLVLVDALDRRRRAAVTAVLDQDNPTMHAGVEVVENADGVAQLVIHPLEYPSGPLVFRRLQDLLGLSPAALNDVRREATGAKGLDRFLPILVKQNLSWEMYARVEHATSLGELPGVDVVASVVRNYRERTLAAHLLGYMNEVTAPELQLLKERGYQRGDYLGRRGLERTFEALLRGQDGQEKVVVDAKGRRLSEDKARSLLGDERREEPVPGQSLVLTIDLDLQRAAESSFRGKAGAVVAVEVATGSVLALASFPPYDPNVVSAHLTATEKRALDADPLQPWINKAIQQHYSPGSTFKIITGIAGLLENKITTESPLYCPGFFSLGATQWRCFNRSGHGWIALEHAVTVSCDAYFYRVGYTLGGDALAKHARQLGLGMRSGIPLDGETPGLIPDDQYYRNRFGASSPGYVVNNAIGQGDVNVTPLQLAMAYAAIVNGGTLYEPRLVERTQDAMGRTVREFPPRARSHVDLPERGMRTLVEGMAGVVKAGGTASGIQYKEDPPGLGLWVRTSGIAIGGKTGTAQVARLSKQVAHIDAAKMEYDLRDHAWFAGFAPVEKPEIVVVTLTEHGGFGGSISAPVSASVIRAYFEKKGFLIRPEHPAAVKAPVPVAAPAPAIHEVEE